MRPTCKLHNDSSLLQDMVCKDVEVLSLFNLPEETTILVYKGEDAVPDHVLGCQFLAIRNVDESTDELFQK